MKENFIIQVHNGEKEVSHLKEEAKKMWKAAGNLVKDIKSMNLYIKPHENKCYYLINEEFSGDINLI